jgi:hypothetical protein
MVFEPRNPIPCVTPLGDAYILYIKTNGFLENDEVTCVLFKDGCIKHFTTEQIKIWHNETYKIKKQANE